MIASALAAITGSIAIVTVPLSRWHVGRARRDP
jgi:hypothetical protein